MKAVATAADTASPLHSELRAIERRRVRRVLMAVGSLQAGITGAWGLFFSWLGVWHVVLMDLAMLAVGLAVLQLARRGRLRSAALLLLPLLYVNLVLMAAVFDIPSAEVPRSAHLYLLALAIGCYVILQHERPWLRHGAALLCMATFLVFASTPTGFETPYAMPDSVRASGTWVNNGLALLCIGVLLVTMQANVTVRTRLESELRKAVLQHELVLHYQPLVDRDGRVLGAEALVRWQHPTRGLLPPGEFIPLAERTGQILPLGDWVLESACQQLLRWARHPDSAQLTLSVNVSAQQFALPDFAERVLATVARTGVNARLLKLELTESVLVQDLNDVITKMTALRTQGLGLSLDDFGTGYSSLSYLRRLPLTQLKIDKSFVRDVLTDPQDAAIARTVIALGQSLRMPVVAEGVETTGQRDFLIDSGCEAFQGYLFSRPVPAEEFLAYARGRAPTPPLPHRGGLAPA